MSYKAVVGGNWNRGDHTGVSQFRAPWPNQLDGLMKGDGIICHNGENVYGNTTRLKNILDVTSKTFAIGELVVEWCRHTSRGFSTTAQPRAPSW
jgi:hypothetical protein